MVAAGVRPAVRLSLLDLRRLGRRRRVLRARVV